MIHRDLQYHLDVFSIRVVPEGMKPETFYWGGLPLPEYHFIKDPTLKSKSLHCKKYPSANKEE